MFFTFFLLFAHAAPASAREYDTYRADYFKGAFCQAIGGACAADNDMITGLFQNPASLATGVPGWDFDGDYASRAITEPGVSGNNGAAESFAVGGIAYSAGRWGAGVSFIWRRANVDSDTSITSDNGSSLNTKLYGHAYTTQIRFPFAYHFDSGASLGATVSVNSQHQELNILDSSQIVRTSDERPKIRLLFGGLLPVTPALRLGSWLRLPITLTDDITFSSSSTGTVSYKEDFSLRAPWILGTGAQYELNSRWSLFGETDFIGPTANGFLFSYRSFSNNPPTGTIVEKGRYLVVEPHLGARHKVSDKFRIHFGSYYENSRWEKVAGRLHGTGGLSYEISKIFEIIIGIDAARRYSQLFFTFR